MASLPKELAQRQRELFAELSHPTSTLSVEALLDVIVAIYEECSRLDKKQPPVQGFVQKYKPTVDRIQNLRISMKDFKVVKLLGRGAFGEVALCSCRLNDRYYAIKKLKKSEMIARQEAFFMEERELLAMAKGQWITSLEFAFQDDEYLYLVMEYLAGGNLLNLLYKQNTFDEETAKFYIAEAVLGVQEIHDMGFVYRDLKPDNMLLNHDGHLKLADFGSCIRLDANGYVNSKVAVGTPYYISPEVLRAQEGRGDAKNGVESDWWSVGVVLYEMLVGDPPFYSESLVETYGMIMNYKTALQFPEEIELSSTVLDLIKSLICDREDRLNISGIKSHLFFKGLDWDDIRNQKPPFVPELKGPDDTSNFDDEFDDVDSSHTTTKKLATRKEFLGEALAFSGYSFNRETIKVGILEPNVNGTTGVAAANPANDAEIKKAQSESERWQKQYKEEKQRFLQVEELRDALATELDRKERLLKEEADARKAAEESVTSLKKSAKIIELEAKELERKLAAETAEKRAVEERIKELEEQLNLAIKARDDLAASFSATNADKESSTSELAALKRKLEDEANHVKALEERIADMIYQKAEIELQLQAANEKISQENERYEAVESQIRDLTRNLADAASKETKLVSAAEKRDKEIADLQAELVAVKGRLEQEAKSKLGLQQSKSEADSQRTMLELEISQINERLQREEKKVAVLTALNKELEDAISAHRHENDQSASATALQAELEAVKVSLSVERNTKESLEKKLSELERERASLGLQIASLENKLAEQNTNLTGTTAGLERLQKLLDKKTEEEAEKEQIKNELEAKLLTLQSELDTTKDSLKEQRAITARLMTQRSDMEKGRKAAEEKLEALTQKSTQENEARQHLVTELEELQTKLQKEKHAIMLMQSNIDALTSSKESATRELEKLKKRLDDITQLKREQDDQLSELRKSKAEADFELAQLEKKYTIEAEQRAELDEQLKALTLENSKTAVSAAELAEHLAKVREENAKQEQTIQTMKDELAAESEQRREIEKNLEDAKKNQENTKLKLDAAVRKLSEQQASPTGQAANDLPLRKEFRKLKDDYTSLQMRFNSSEAERKKLEAQLVEAKSKLAELPNKSEGEDLMRRTTSLSRQLSKNSGSKSMPGLDNIDTKAAPTIDTNSAAGAGGDSSIFSFIKRRSTRRDPKTPDGSGTTRGRPLSLLMSTQAAPGPAKVAGTDFHITASGFEGWLKVPKEKGIRQGFYKKYVIVRDTKIIMFDDKSKTSLDGQIIADVRSHIFVVRDPTADITQGMNSKDVASMFLIYSKNHASEAELAKAAAPAPAAAALPPLDPAHIATKIKGLEKELEIEERMCKGAMAMIPLASGDQKKKAQKQVDGSIIRLAQLKKDLAKWQGLQQASSTPEASKEPDTSLDLLSNESPRNKVLKKIESIQKAIVTEEKIKSGAQTLLSMAGNDSKRDTARQQLEATTNKILQLNAELAHWQDQLKRGVFEVEPIKRRGERENRLSSATTLQIVESELKQQDQVSITSSSSAASSLETPELHLHEFNGHKYQTTKFSSPIHCQVCAQLMFGGNQGFQCTVCKFVVHSHCYTSGGPSCDDIQSIKEVKPLIFMAVDEADRDRWVTNIIGLREALMNEVQSPNSSSPFSPALESTSN